MTHPLITAVEALALDPTLSLDASLAELDALIRRCAANGQYHARAPHSLTKINGVSVSFKTPGVEEALEAAGYDVNHRYEDRQFVDVWIEISWGDRA